MPSSKKNKREPLFGHKRQALIRLFKTFSLSYYKKSIFRGGVAIMGITLGVAVLYSMNAATFSAFAQFKQGVQQVAGDTTLEVKPSNSTFIDESYLETVYKTLEFREKKELDASRTIVESGPLPRFTDARPVLEMPSLLLKKDRETGDMKPSGQVLTLLGIDVFSDTEHRHIEWLEAPSFSADSGEASLLDANSLAISDTVAKKMNLHRGDTFPILVQDAEKTVTVAGIFKTDTSNTALRNMAITDIGILQAMTGQKGQLSRIDLTIGHLMRSDQKKLRTALDDALPDDAMISTPDARSQNIDHMVRSYQVNLMALSFITLIVAAFLIYNTLSMAVLQRRQEIGTFRLLGMNAATLSRFIKAEALVLGLVGSLIGLTLGGLLLPIVGGAVSSTLQTVYTGQSVSTFFAPGWLWPACLAIGLITSLLGAHFPVQEALQIEPSESVRPTVNTPQDGGRRLKLAGMGVVFLVVAWGMALLPPMFDLPIGGYISAFFILAGSTFLTPMLLNLSLSTVQTLAKRFNAPAWFRVGMATLQGGMHRASVAVASLMVALALSISLTTLIGSFRQSVEGWINQSLRADIFIQPEAASTNRSLGLMNGNTVAALSDDPAITAADPFLERRFEYNNKPFYLGAANLDTFSEHAKLSFTHGESSKAVLNRVLEDSRNPQLSRNTPYLTIISEPFAFKHRLKRGDNFELNMPNGKLNLRVEGIYLDYASSLGYAIIHRGLYQYYGGAQADDSTSLALYLKKGTDPQTVISRLEDKIPEGSYISMRSNSELREEVLTIFDKTFSITYLMQSVAIIISILTVLHALTALIIDGRAIYATLYCMGMPKESRRLLVLAQGMFLSVFGYVVALGTGSLLAVILIYVLNAQSFGWTVPLSIPWGFLATNIFWVLASGIVASLLPLYILKRNNPSSALRYE